MLTFTDLHWPPRPPTGWFYHFGSCFKFFHDLYHCKFLQPLLTSSHSELIQYWFVIHPWFSLIHWDKCAFSCPCPIIPFLYFTAPPLWDYCSDCLLVCSWAQVLNRSWYQHLQLVSYCIESPINSRRCWTLVRIKGLSLDISKAFLFNVGHLDKLK